MLVSTRSHSWRNLPLQRSTRISISFRLCTAWYICLACTSFFACYCSAWLLVYTVRFVLMFLLLMNRALTESHFFSALLPLGLAVRWKDFRKVPFSPAHAAFCAPSLSHANAVQAYIGAINSFSNIPAGNPFKIALYCYWVTVLVGGTIVTLVISYKFVKHLPEWTHIDTSEEDEPPAPNETAMTSSNLVSAGETLLQPFVSPAILQANETGALMMSRNAQGGRVYRRTRRVRPISCIALTVHVVQVRCMRLSSSFLMPCLSATYLSPLFYNKHSVGHRPWI
jgi:hypothetical protein